MIYIVTKRNEKGYSELVKAFKSAHIARQYVLDHNNSSGLSTSGSPPLVAIFTYHDAIAEKKGMVAFLCPSPTKGLIPDYSIRRKIEKLTAKTVHEHIIIYIYSIKRQTKETQNEIFYQ